jgi:hypothetical protein
MPQNNYESNTIEDLSMSFMDSFEANRVLTKTLDSQIIGGKFTPRSGGKVSVRRPHDYTAIETPRGNISGMDKNNMVAGKATAEVQNYITVTAEWENIEEALEMDQMDKIIAPMATRAVTQLEQNLGRYMIRNAGLTVGLPGVSAKDWVDVSRAGALLEAIGVPKDNELNYVMNSFQATELAGAQLDLNNDDLVRTAWERAQISNNVGGMRVLSSNGMASLRDDGALVDRAGTVAEKPVATYEAHKDEMIQVIAIEGFTPNAKIVAGSSVEVTGRHYLNQHTRDIFVDANGEQVTYRATVTQDVVLDGSGAGDLMVTGPAIFESNGAYNTVDTAIEAGDVIKVLGTAGYLSQPNLFYHRQAFGMATVALPKLFSTDTIAETEDGFSLRVSKYSDGDSNKQMVRFDIVPAFVTFNPFFAGRGNGRA